jgi:beta-lactamase superfamily II metal-dependent hydrolase
MFDGIEIDMLNLGDADCILVTQWAPFGPQRVLIDGGNGDDAPTVKEFLRARNATFLYAVVCSHSHKDHASGLVKLVQDKSITICTGWMHDIRNHLSPAMLRSASAGNSARADGVRQVIETTKELAAAFASRQIAPVEPFAGATIAAFPDMTVIGPRLPYYQNLLREVTDQVPPVAFPPVRMPPVSISDAMSKPIRLSALPSPGFAGIAPVPPLYQNLSSMLAAIPPPPALQTGFTFSSVLAGVLSDSSVKEAPKTQPFNNTSTILGVRSPGGLSLFTADTGSEALARVPACWNGLMWMQVPHHGSDGNLSQKDIERFRPRIANISACGDSSHPDRAIVSGLVKVGAKVFSTHQNGHLWFWSGAVPARPEYGSAVEMKGTGNPQPNYLKFLNGTNG